MKREKVSGRKLRKRIVLFGGSFNPPHIPHEKIAGDLAERYDLVYVIPCGYRKDKLTTNTILPEHRMEMVKLAFKNIPKVKLDLYDLENDVFTPNYLLQKRYEELYPDVEIWHLIGEDIIAGRCRNESEIQKGWDNGSEIWNKLNFLVIIRPGYEARAEDLPPNSETIEIKGMIGSGTMIRDRIRKGKSIEGLVDPKVIEYIKKNNLYARI